MSCGSCGFVTEFQPEYTRRYKPENNTGCCGRAPDDCSQPSRAMKDSPRWLWEQEHGKIITTVTMEIGSDGRFHQVITKEICPTSTGTQRQQRCCALRYTVPR